LDKALVSVIVPAFNAAAYIRQTLYSVLAQTYRKIEVIVVDDGSSDSTAKIVEEFVASDLQFQLIRQANAGVGAARNTAIKRARGKYLAPLDTDDLWFPKKLETQVACMEQPGIETGLVYCSSSLIDEQGKLLHVGDTNTLEGRLRHAMVLKNLLGNASVPLFRASALEKVGLYLTRAEEQGGQGCEDWDLALRIAGIFDVRVVPERLVQFLLYRLQPRILDGLAVVIEPGRIHAQNIATSIEPTLFPS
jgi:glycosyltransferase involved in cell wall biosynthesis